MTSPFSLLLAYYEKDDPDFISRALKSTVVDQTLQPSEVVLVEDGPVPSELRAAVDLFIRTSPVPVRRILLERNGGLAVALTAGLRESKYPVIARMDADDISEPDRFAVQLPMLDAGLDVVGSALLEFEESNVGSIVPVRTRRAPVGEEHVARYSRFHVPVHHPSVVFRKDAVERAGGYQAFGAMEDYWLWARLINLGARFDNYPLPLVRYRISSGAYARRGGLSQLRTELRLQRALRGLGFTTRLQCARNLLIRGGYRLLPEWARRMAYRRIILGKESGS